MLKLNRASQPVVIPPQQAPSDGGQDGMTKPPPPVAPAPVAPPAAATYLWRSPNEIRHSIRVIADEEGLVGIDPKDGTHTLKDTLCATIQGESGFDLSATNKNYAFRPDGTKYVASTDSGLCQWNDKYHGKEITPQEAMQNPEKAVRLMCAYWRRGQQHQWCAYDNGRYKLFL